MVVIEIIAVYLLLGAGVAASAAGRQTYREVKALVTKTKPDRRILHDVKRWFRSIGLYRHYKGGLYLVLGWSWESSNHRDRARHCIYFSLKKLQLNHRLWMEFFERDIFFMMKVPESPRSLRKFTHLGGISPYRFKKIFPPRPLQPWPTYDVEK